jgi:hypothetical protein
MQCVRLQLYIAVTTALYTHLLTMYTAPPSLREPLSVSLIKGHYVLYSALKFCGSACLRRLLSAVGCTDAYTSH